MLEDETSTTVLYNPNEVWIINVLLSDMMSIALFSDRPTNHAPITHWNNDMLLQQHLWPFMHRQTLNVRYDANLCWMEKLLFYLLGWIPTCCPKEPLVLKFSLLSQQVCSTDTQTRLGESFTSRGHKKWATLCVQAFRPNAYLLFSVKPRVGRVMCTFNAECILEGRIRYGSETWLPFVPPREFRFLSIALVSQICIYHCTMSFHNLSSRQFVLH